MRKFVLLTAFHEREGKEYSLLVPTAEIQYYRVMDKHCEIILRDKTTLRVKEDIVELSSQLFSEYDPMVKFKERMTSELIPRK